MPAKAKAKFNQAKYRDLLAEVLPQVIETEGEYERALQLVEPMMSRDLSPEEAKLFDLLVRLIQDYEEKKYPIEKSAPHEVLQHLMEARDLRQRDLVEIFGSSGRVSEALSGKRAISKNQAKALSEFFHLPADLFI
jgi:HTH-type transcriptional regulator/antitoxin HigA